MFAVCMIVNFDRSLGFYAFQYAEVGSLTLNEHDEHVVCLYTFIMHDLGFG